MDAGKRDITTIFNKARTLEIPFFQRSYVWERENWERFAEDLIDIGRYPRGYFLGSIILKQKDTSTHSQIGDVRVIVDGQQRLTSLVLFFRVLCDASGKTDLFDQIFINLVGELILQHNHNDIEIFEAIARSKDISENLRARYSGNRVLKAYDYFCARRSTIAGVDPMTLIKHLYVVGIDLGKDEDEQQIFDTINSLGVDLTAAELLKNLLYDRSDLDLFERTWRASFEQSEQQKHYWSLPVTSGRARRQNVDLFLQGYLLNQAGVSDDVKVGDLFGEYKRYLAEGVTHRDDFIYDLTASADLYRRHLNPRLMDRAIDRDNPHERLNIIIFGLQITTVLPFYLNILRSVNDANERRKMLRLLETYLIRRLICRETAKHYNRFFAGLARSRLSTYDELLHRIMRSEDPSTHLPSDDSLREAFQQSNLTNQQARVVLYLLERSIRDDAKHSTALAGFRHYTLEHIMPKKWQNHWGPVPPEMVDARNRAVRKLGNLTLLSAKLNNSIRDADWATKKLGSAKRAGLNHYGVGLEILSRDLQEPSWTEEQIRTRGRRLSEQALGRDVWPYPGMDD